MTDASLAPRTIHRAGTRALLVDLPDLAEVMTWHAALTAQPLAGQTSAIAAARTVLLEFATPRDAQRAVETLAGFSPAAAGQTTPREVTIDVIYDGEDLASTAEHLSISTEELINRHTSQAWMAAFGGFAPGFTYCVPADASTSEGAESFVWNVPRRANPRTAVPAGAVGLAGEFSAVYPRQSPGGWQLLGHTKTPMWDPSAEHPALLNPGDIVRYRAVRAEASGAASSNAGSGKAASQHNRTQAAILGRPVATLTDAGLLSLVQDRGRPGHGDIGVTRSGALDRASARAANAAVGNHSSAAVIENIGGLRITANVDTVLAVTGAEATVEVSTRSGQQATKTLAQPIGLLAGEELAVRPTGTGARSYVAIRGGLATDTVLDSAASDVLSGMGPAPLADGDLLKAGRATRTAVDPTILNPADSTNAATLRCVLGPRDDWFAEQTVQDFLSTTWEVSGQSNRIGLRMTGPEGAELTREREEELASEGMLPGSIQVPPNGLPVLFLADHPVTGGYPVIATVIPEDMDAAGQLPPGSTVTFRAVDPDTLAELPINPTDQNTDTQEEEQ
ncbi:carboxyltransferase domain-containing protein [Corynebacterium urealyticum]|uniref:Carboxyltransferase domain-containing protein n=1 Tax=Corynebacterium urealyticum TaxID=43771 RepID=A0A5D4FZY2_9CORY|nr:carboxyltransferase domain-containing protein [Corynebacterium urealyticum]TYR20849.1 carboxyltransferase domain-containing protein [Corynebacterium urealyticum]